MLGILLVLIIAKKFFKLAEKYKQHKWLFGIVGVLTYYVGAFVGGIVIGLLDEFIGLGIDWDNTILLTVIAMPFGLGSVYLVYYLLEKNWKKNFVEDTYEIQEIGQHRDD